MFVALPAQMVYRGENRSHNKSEKALFSSCRLAASFFLAIFVHFAAQASFSTPITSTGQVLGFQVHHDQALPLYQPIRSASHPNTSLFVTEFLKETEGQEKPTFQKVFDFLNTSQEIVKKASIGASENLFQELIRSLQNRPALSLFILHHSWKSFLI
jgi:hypothetical protein